MTVGAAIVLPPFFLENNDLFATGLLHQLAGDGRASHQRRAHGGIAIGAQHQDILEGHFIAGLARDPFNLDHVVGGDTVLLTASFNYCEHLMVHLSIWCGPDCSRARVTIQTARTPPRSARIYAPPGLLSTAAITIKHMNKHTGFPIWPNETGPDPGTHPGGHDGPNGRRHQCWPHWHFGTS